MARLNTRIGICPNCRQHTVYIDQIDWKGAKLFRGKCEVCSWVCPAGAETSALAAETSVQPYLLAEIPDAPFVAPSVKPEWERPECGGRELKKHPAEMEWTNDRRMLGRYPTAAEVVATSQDLTGEMDEFNKLANTFTKRVSANYHLTKEMLATLELNLNSQVFRPEVMDTMRTLVERWRRQFNETWPKG